MLSVTLLSCANRGDTRLAGSEYYPESKPYTRWWWFAAPVDTADILYQLDWLRMNGFGGVEIAWVYPGDGEPKEGTPAWLSAEWSDLVSFTKREAERRGLGCDYTFGTLWPFGDSRVPPEDGARVYGEDGSAAGMRLTWEHPVRGRVLNHLDSTAFRRYAERVGDALKPAMGGRSSGIFCDSWEVETRRIWTDGLGDTFRQRYGYRLEPFMARIYEPGYENIFYDYMKLVSGYVLNQFYAPFTAKAHSLGGFSRAQCGGAPVDLLTAFSLVDVPETEAILYEPGFARIPVSAAVLSGRPLVSSETFTCIYGWKGWPGPGPHQGEEKIADLKLLADALVAHGVNHLIWHGMPFNGKNGENRFYASVHLGPDAAFADMLPLFNAYMETVCGYMRRGRPYSNIAMYLPLEDSWLGVEYPDSLKFPWVWGEYEQRYLRPSELLRGCQPLWINDHFLKRSTLENGRLNCGEASFSALYIDAEYMDGETVRTVIDLARRGFPVAVTRPPKEPGHIKDPAYPALVKELFSLPSVSRQGDAILPEEPLVAGTHLPPFWCRETDKEAYIFFAHPAAGGLSYPLPYGYSEEAGPLSRTVTVTWRHISHRVVLDFSRCGSLLLKVTERGVERIDLPGEHRLSGREEG
ncbi:hypothetical protein JXO52_06805 [bacterium]|nr:hypothetical protein [bacterium]